MDSCNEGSFRLIGINDQYKSGFDDIEMFDRVAAREHAAEVGARQRFELRAPMKVKAASKRHAANKAARQARKRNK